MMQRDVTDADGTTWTLAQALAGASSEHAEASTEIAKRLTDKPGTVPVVATPRGGAQTVHLELADGWHEAMTDDDLVSAVAAVRGDA